MSEISEVRARAKALARADREHISGLVALRRIRGLTQKDVANLIGVSARKIARLERHDSDPRASMLRRYASAIGVTVEHTIVVTRARKAS